MPFGLQVIGPFRSEGRTLDIAQGMEEAFASSPTLSRPRPDLQRLANTETDPPLKSIVTSSPYLATTQARGGAGEEPSLR